MKYIKILVVVGLISILSLSTNIHKLLAGGFQDIVMKSTVHYLKCDEFPTKLEVQVVYDKHIDVIEKIKKEADLHFSVSDGLETNPITDQEKFCTEKGQLYAMTCCESKRKKALEIINSDRFFGVPYTIINN
jgi:hypothetical protein